MIHNGYWSDSRHQYEIADPAASRVSGDTAKWVSYTLSLCACVGYAYESASVLGVDLLNDEEATQRLLSEAPQAVVEFLREVAEKNTARRKIDFRHLHYVTKSIAYFALDYTGGSLSSAQQDYIFDNLSARCTECGLEVSTPLLLMVGQAQAIGDHFTSLEDGGVPELFVFVALLRSWAEGKCPKCNGTTVEVRWNG